MEPVKVSPPILQSFDLKSTFGAKKIVLIVQQQRGFGDLSNGYRMGEALVKRGNLDPQNIIVATNDPEGMRAFNELKFEVITREETRHLKNVALQIIVPAYGCRLHEIVINVPILCFEEYGFSERNWRVMNATLIMGTFRTMGLDKKTSNDVGIWISSDLLIESHTSLQGMSPSLRTCLSEKNDENFYKENKLYLGYAYSESITLKKAYVKSIVDLNENDSIALTVVLPGNIEGCPLEAKLRGVFKPTIFEDKEFQEYVKSKGIGSIVHKTYGKAIKEQSLTLNSIGKSLTIISGKIDPKDMMILWKTSEKEVLSTGDQSAGEAISANKSMVYECGPHKTDFAESLNSIYGDRVICLEGDSKDHEAITKVFRNNQKDNYKELTGINYQIAKDYDCFPEVVKSINQSLVTKVEEVEDLRGQVEKLTPSQLAFNKTCLVSIRDVLVKLQITEKEFFTSAFILSPVSDFKDSVFTFSKYDNETIGLVRIKRTEKHDNLLRQWNAPPAPVIVQSNPFSYGSSPFGQPSFHGFQSSPFYGNYTYMNFKDN